MNVCPACGYELTEEEQIELIAEGINYHSHYPCPNCCADILRYKRDVEDFFTKYLD